MKPDLSAVPPLHHNLGTRAVVGDALTRTATMFGDRTAVTDATGEVTYRELDRASDALARALLAGGPGRQQPVAMVTMNSWRMLAGYFACAKAALVAVPVNVALTPADIAWILRDAGVTVVIVDQGLTGLLGEFLTDPPTGLRLIVIGDDPETALPGPTPCPPRSSPTPAPTWPVSRCPRRCWWSTSCPRPRPARSANTWCATGSPAPDRRTLAHRSVQPDDRSDIPCLLPLMPRSSPLPR